MIASEDIWSPERQASALDCAQAWAGTPWGNRRSEIGRAVDCIHFVVRVLEAAGIFPPIQLPYYSHYLGIRCERNVMSELFIRAGYVQEIEDRPPPFGAILIWKVGRTSNHVGIMLDGPWHVMRRSVVKRDTWDNIAGSIEAVLRITQCGLRADPAMLDVG